MKNMFQRFLPDDSGAVTVDWVVLTASVIMLAASSFYLIVDARDNVNATTVSKLESVTF